MCDTNLWDEARPQHRELRALLLSTSVHVDKNKVRMMFKLKSGQQVAWILIVLLRHSVCLSFPTEFKVSNIQSCWGTKTDCPQFGSFRDFALPDYWKFILVPEVLRISGISIHLATWKVNFVTYSQITEKKALNWWKGCMDPCNLEKG